MFVRKRIASSALCKEASKRCAALVSEPNASRRAMSARTRSMRSSPSRMARKRSGAACSGATMSRLQTRRTGAHRGWWVAVQV